MTWVAGSFPTHMGGGADRGQRSSSRSSRTREASKPSIRSIAPAAAAAAPAGIRPTSSEPATSTPRAAGLRRRPARRSRAARPPPSPRRSCSPGRGRRAAGRGRARARPGSRRRVSRTTAAIARATSTSSLRRLTLKAISGRRAPTSTAPARGIELRRAEVRRELARVDPPLELLRPAAPEERRAAARRRRRGRPADRARRSARPPPAPPPARPLHVLRAHRDERDDVRRADPRMRALVPAQVDALARALDAGDERRRRAPSSVPTSVNTERLWSASAWTSSSRAGPPSAAASASIVARSRPSEKFGTDSSGSTSRTLGAGEGLLPRARPRVRRLVARPQPLRRRAPPRLGGGARRARELDRRRCRPRARSTSPAARAS